MRILIATCLALGAIAATASAQALVILALCNHDDPAGPTFSSLQVSEAAHRTCMDVTLDNSDFCLGIDELSADAGMGLACADAIRNLQVFGVDKTFFAAVTPTPPEVRPVSARGQGVANGRPAHANQHNQTDLQFLLERADGSVDLVGCTVFAADGPAATYVQSSDSAADDAADLSCADALQDSLDTGAVLSETGSLAIASAPHPGVRMQQGRVILDSDFNETKPAEFVLVRVGQWTMDAP